MSSVGYTAGTSSAVSLTAATAKTAFMFITPAQFGAVIRKFRVSFLGVTASEVPALVEIVRSTNATNSTPGTNNTNENANIVQYKGRSITAGFTAFSASTSEPTVLTILDRWTCTPAGGLVIYDDPLGDEYECDVSAGLGIRLTAPSAVTARAQLHVERI